MIKRIILALMTVMPFGLMAQVEIQPHAAAGGLMLKDQLWDVILINHQAANMTCQLQVQVQDAVNGQIVLTGTSGNFLLPEGVKNLTQRDLQPIVYSNNAGSSSNSFMQAGKYLVCYQLFQKTKSGAALGNECVSLNVSPISPPLLNTPMDKSELVDKYPVFSWIAPSPAEMFTDLRYDLVLKEIKDGQSPEDAIQFNQSLLQRSQIRVNNEAYPQSFRSLETGKTYAWQVVAHNGISSVGKTEVWTFKLKREVPAETKTHDSTYMKLHEDVKGTYIVSQRHIAVKYFSAESQYSGEILIVGADGRVIQKETQPISPGDNYFKIKLGKGIKKDKDYRLTLGTPELKKYSMLFRLDK